MGSFIKDTLSVTISRGVVILSGLGTAIITARVLGPEKSGIFSSIVVFPTLIMSIGSLGIRQSTTYFVGKQIYPIENIKTAIVQIWFFTSLISLLLSFGFIKLLASNKFPIEMIMLAIAPIPFSLFTTYNSGIFLGKNQIREFNRINWVPNLIVFLSTSVLLLFFKLEVNGALIATLIGPLVLFLLYAFRNNFFKSLKFSIEIKIIKDLMSLGVIYAIALMIINLNYRIDIILLEKLSNSYEIGIYTKGATITQYLWQIPMVLSTIVFARSSATKDNLGYSFKVAKLLRISIVVTAVLSILLLLLSKPIILMMFGSEFIGSVRVLQILLPGVVILTVFKVMNMDLAGKGKPWVSMKAMIPGLIINILLNFWLLPSYGARGAAISSTISYTVCGVLFTLFYSRVTGLKISEIFKFKWSEFHEIFHQIKSLRK